MSEQTLNASPKTLEAIARGATIVGEVEKEFGKELRRFEKADLPEPVSKTPITEMYTPDPNAPQLIVTKPASTDQTEAHSPSESVQNAEATPVEPAARFASLRRILSAFGLKGR